MINLIEWKEEYSVGVSEIDTQHQKLVEIINELFHAVEESKEKERIPFILTELVSYAEYHFSTEEKHFEEFDFEGKEEHIKVHDSYREKIAQFLERYKEDESLLSLEIMSFLKEWWLGHIRGMDRGYIDCFHKHGLY